MADETAAPPPPAAQDRATGGAGAQPWNMAATFTPEQFIRLLANLLRNEPDEKRVHIGTYDAMPPPRQDRQLFHDLMVNLTVGDLRRWAPGHVKVAKPAESDTAT